MTNRRRYFAFLLFSGATLITSLKPFPVSAFLFWCDQDNSSISAKDYYSLSWTQHALGWGASIDSAAPHRTAPHRTISAWISSPRVTMEAG
jgi:hypothetical protein